MADIFRKANLEREKLAEKGGTWTTKPADKADVNSHKTKGTMTQAEFSGYDKPRKKEKK